MSLTEKQTLLVDLSVNGLTHAAMAEAAGYSHGNAVTRELKNPRVVAAIKHRLQVQMQGEIAPEAVKTLRTIMNDDRVTPSTRVDAAKTLLDRAGFIAPKAKDPDQAETKRPEDMTTTELAGLIERLEREKSDRAAVVNASNDAPDEAKSLDFLE